MGGYNKIVVKSINMEPYGLTGTWTGPVTIGPSSAIKNKQYNFSKAKQGRFGVPRWKKAEGGYIKKMRRPQKK